MFGAFGGNSTEYFEIFDLKNTILCHSMFVSVCFYSEFLAQFVSCLGIFPLRIFSSWSNAPVLPQIMIPWFVVTFVVMRSSNLFADLLDRTVYPQISFVHRKITIIVTDVNILILRGYIRDWTQKQIHGIQNSDTHPHGL